MSSCIDGALRISVFGQSHSAAIGCSIDGIPAGVPIDLDELQAFLDRRAPGRDETATARRESDTLHVISGIVDGRTCGAPIAAIIQNGDTRSQDYSELRRVPRPGHADLAAYERYRNNHDVAGGGHFSGRLTAPLCIAGGIAKQLLALYGVTIAAHISSLGTHGTADTPLDQMKANKVQLDAIASNPLPCISAVVASRMRAEIMEAKGALDSIGGTIECAAYDVPAGIGDPMFDGIENRIARIAFGIPAVKGIEFGAGFGAANLTGSENNDAYRIVEGVPAPSTNNAGGILGGITTGLPVIWRMAVKPTPSIGREQQSVDLETGRDATLKVRGRHDPCIVPRAVPVAEAVCAIALLGAMIEDGALDPTGSFDARFHAARPKTE